ncbi:MAG: hypothetical protein WCT18_01595 [Patescibacteria group bacterium]
MKKNKQNYCSDCELPKSSHYGHWVEEIFSQLSFIKNKHSFFDRFSDRHLDKILAGFFGFFGLVKWQTDFPDSAILPRGRSFINEARKNNAQIAILKSKLGYTNHFRLKINGRTLYFDGLPTPQFIQKNQSSIFDDKQNGKELLQQAGFPILPGKSFWFWQSKKALAYSQKIGFPLVVKPRYGSVARHVRTNIQNLDELKKAIKKSLEYSPTFLIEKYFQNGFAHRVTIIDTEHIFVARQEPAHIIGDGKKNILALIEQKNSEPIRHGDFYHPLVFDETSEKLLLEQNLDKNSILKENQKIYLQKDPFLRLGGDFFDVTEQTSPENKKMFLQIAKTFDLKIFGLDFMSRDISIPWTENHGAILEINSLPCLEIHELAQNTTTPNLGKFIFQLLKKYYL